MYTSRKFGPYSEHGPAHEKALRLQAAGCKSIRIDKVSRDNWWITAACPAEVKPIGKFAVAAQLGEMR
jgi:hypothetical protein